MTFLELKGISKDFGQFTAVDSISLAVERGEFITLLGPSGCGKTTILRMIAGFETPSEGIILLDGENVTGRPASKRPMGMVFQSYALFPHLTAEQNVAFGMSIRRQPKEVIARRCTELLELVGLSDKGRSYPHQLSGGQQQLKMTAIYVTHDQEEALAISDRIAVMAKGKIEQLDQPEEIYSNPRSVFAATFVGTSNHFKGVLVSAAEGICQVEKQTLHVPSMPDLHNDDRVLVLVRPEVVNIHDASEAADPRSNNASNSIAGTIELRTFLGPFTRFHVRVNEETTLTADVPSQQARNFYVAQPVVLSFPPAACQVLLLDAGAIELEKIVEAEKV